MNLLQIAQRAVDLDRAADFYTALLERDPLARFADPDLLFFELDGVRLLLDTKAPTSLISLRVDNVHETLERLGVAAQVITPAHVVFVHDNGTLGPVGFEEWQAFIRDSEGNTLGLVSFQRP